MLLPVGILGGIDQGPEDRRAFILARPDQRDRADVRRSAHPRSTKCRQPCPGRGSRRRGSPAALPAPWRHGPSSPGPRWTGRTGRASPPLRPGRTRRGSGRATRLPPARTPVRSTTSSSIGSRAASPSRLKQLAPAVERARQDRLEKARRRDIVGHRQPARQDGVGFGPVRLLLAPARRARSTAGPCGRGRDRKAGPGPSRSAAKPAG